MPRDSADWLGMAGDKEPQQGGLLRRLSQRLSTQGPQDASRPSLWRQLYIELAAVLLGSKMSFLLLLLPFAIISAAVGWPAGATFLLALLPLCSLAERLGFITEQLAMYTNDTLGGLLNATFGNATEVIIAGFAIQNNYLRVVKLTLLGSIVSNLLLVMGSAFLAGGLLHPTQRFNQQGIGMNSGLLILAVVTIALPTLISETDPHVHDTHGELALSRFESLFMLLCYGLFLVFQLYTHRFLYEEQPDMAGAAKRHIETNEHTAYPARPDSVLSALQSPTAAASSSANGPLRRAGGSSSSAYVEVELAGMTNGVAGAGKLGSSREAAVQIEVAADELERQALIRDTTIKAEEDEEEEERLLSLWGCFIWLAVITVLISVLSDMIMKCIKEASVELSIPMPFLTTIIVPIVGNAAEHASAIVFAIKNRMEISLGVAMGSATQVAVLVVPFCVVLAWMMGRPLDLNFNEFEAMVLFVSVLLAVVVVQDGTSNWLKGAMLVLSFLFISAAFFVHKDPDLSESVDALRHHHSCHYNWLQQHCQQCSGSTTCGAGASTPTGTTTTDSGFTGTTMGTGITGSSTGASTGAASGAMGAGDTGSDMASTGGGTGSTIIPTGPSTTAGGRRLRVVPL